jgi:two-component system, cell cycle sensor histidine kinase and response regulator CckA
VTPFTEESSISQNTVPAATGSFASERTVLIVDDDERVLRLMALVLRNSGYHVLEAQTGADALNQCDLWKRTIDLLITDVVMPVMDGPEVARQVQRIYPGIKIGFVSGYFQEEAGIQKFIDEGGQFIAKPFVPEELRDLVGKVLEQ